MLLQGFFQVKSIQVHISSPWPHQAYCFFRQTFFSFANFAFKRPVIPHTSLTPNFSTGTPWRPI